MPALLRNPNQFPALDLLLITAELFTEQKGIVILAKDFSSEYDLAMLKASSVLLLLSSVLAYAEVTTTARVVRLPEPSAFPEFLVCLAGIAYMAWRLRKQPVG